MNARSSRRPVARFRTIATIPAEITTPGIASSAEAAEPAPELGEPEADSAASKTSPGRRTEQDDVGRDVDGSGCRPPRRRCPTTSPATTKGDGVRQSQRPGDDRDERGQAEQADQQLDRVRIAARPSDGHAAVEPRLPGGSGLSDVDALEDARARPPCSTSEAPPCVTNGSGMPGDRHDAEDHPDVDDELEQDHRAPRRPRTACRTRRAIASRPRGHATAAGRRARTGRRRR